MKIRYNENHFNFFCIHMIQYQILYICGVWEWRYIVCHVAVVVEDA